jgi:phosphatidylglycerophosphatase A
VVFDAILRPATTDTRETVAEHFRAAIRRQREELHIVDRWVAAPLRAGAFEIANRLATMHHGRLNAYVAYGLQWPPDPGARLGAGCVPMKRLAVPLSTVGPVGYFPIAPGTAGSAAALPLLALLRWLGSPAVEALTILLLAGAGTWACTVAEEHFGRTDPGIVVLDEVIGMLVTLLFVPLGWTGAAVGFILFRGFDVVKPFPARACERLTGGLGIVADDVVAGLYSNAALRAALLFVPSLR